MSINTTQWQDTTQYIVAELLLTQSLIYWRVRNTNLKHDSVAKVTEEYHRLSNSCTCTKEPLNK